MISIGSVMNGPELDGSETDRLISTVMKAAIKYRDSTAYETGPAINVVYHVPGSLGAPDWEGIRDAKFSRKRQLLMVQVAVPKDQVNSPTLKQYLIDSLHQANAVAFQFFHQKGLVFPLADAESLVQRIAERLDSESQ